MAIVNTQQLHQKLVENMDEAMWMVDKNHKVVYANPQFAQLVGHKQEDMIGKEYADFLCDRSAVKARNVYRTHRSVGESSSYDVNLKTKKGKEIPARVYGTPLAEGGGIGIITDLREVKERESLYQKLVQNMGEAVWLVDGRRKTVYVNPRLCELTGYSSEEMEGRSSKEFFDDANRKIIDDAIRKMKEIGQGLVYEVEVMKKGGGSIPVRISCSPLPDGGRICILTDLRDQKRQNMLYRTLVDHMNEGMFMTDKDDRIVFANDQFCTLVKCESEKVLGEKIYSFADEEYLSTIQYFMAQHRQQGLRSSYESRLVDKEGRRIPVLISGSALPDGGMIVIVSDMTELKEKESYYQKLVENMDEGVLMTGPSQKCVFVNPKLCKMTGYNAEEILSMQSYALFDREGQRKVKRIDRAVRKKGDSSSYEVNLLKKDGTLLPVLINGTPLPGGGTIGVINDLSVILEKEAKERVLNTAIQYASDAIVTFDKEGKIDSWNQGAKTIFGYKQKEILGERIDKIFGMEDCGEILGASEISYNREIDARHKNKRHIKISATLTPLFLDRKKEISFYLMTARDITHKVKVEEELALKYEKIREAYNSFGIIRRQMDYFYELLELSNENPDRKTLADFIVSSVIMLTRVDACILRVRNANKNTLDLVSSFGVSDEWKGNHSIKYRGSLAERAYESGRSLKVIDVTQDPAYSAKNLARKSGLTSMLLIPLCYKGQLIGSVSLYAHPDKKLEIFESEFIEKYAKLVELVVGTTFG